MDKLLPHSEEEEEGFYILAVKLLPVDCQTIKLAKSVDAVKSISGSNTLGKLGSLVMIVTCKLFTASSFPACP